MRTNPGNSTFCMEHDISPYTFEVAYGIRTHLVGQLRASGFIQSKGQSDVLDINQHARNWPLVKAVLTASLQPNIAVVDRVAESLFDRYVVHNPYTRDVLVVNLRLRLNVLMITMETKFRNDNGGLRFSKDAVISIEKPDWAAGIPSDWIIYNEKSTALDGTEVICGCTVVSPVNIAMFAADCTGEFISESLCKTVCFVLFAFFYV